MNVLSLAKAKVRLMSGSEELLFLRLDFLLCHLIVCVMENLISLRLIAYHIHIHIHNLKSRSTSITSHQTETDTSGSEERLLLLLDLLLDLLLVLIENCGLLKDTKEKDRNLLTSEISSAFSSVGFLSSSPLVTCCFIDN